VGGAVGERGTSAPVLSLEAVTAGPPDPLAPDVVREVTLSLGPGQTGVLLGANGSGKTTLLRTAAGLWPLRAGSLRTPAGDRFSPTAVGLVLEDPDTQFVAGTVRGEIVFVLENLGWEPGPLARRLQEVLAAFDLEPLAGRDPRSLSGGEQERALLAAALAPEPPLLLLDDPFLHLGPGAGLMVWRRLRGLAAEGRAGAILLTTHDPELALEADRVGVLAEGRLLAWGEPDTVLRALPGSLAQPVALVLEERLRAAGWRLPAGGLDPEALAGRIAEEARR